MSALTVDQIVDGMQKVLRNAESLIEDAKVLLAAERPTRAFTLSHLAREELSKITMMFRLGVRLLLGLSVDWKQFWKRLANHEKKLTLEILRNYHLLPDVEGLSDEALLKILVASVPVHNTKKNNSLYVSFVDGAFKEPSDSVSPRSAERTVTLASMSLADTGKTVASFMEHASRPKAELEGIFGKMIELAEDPASVIPAMYAIRQVIGEHLYGKRDEADSSGKSVEPEGDHSD